MSPSSSDLFAHRSRGHAVALVIVPAVLLFTACLRPIYVAPQDGTGKGDWVLASVDTKPSPCAKMPPVLMEVPTAAKVVRELSTTCNPGRPTDCEEQLARRACEVGADAIVLGKAGSTAPSPGTMGPTLLRTRFATALKLP